MSRANVIILFAFVAQGHGEEMLPNQAPDAQDSNVLTDSLVDNLIDKFVGNMAAQTHADLDNTTVAQLRPAGFQASAALSKPFLRANSRGSASVTRSKPFLRVNSLTAGSATSMGAPSLRSRPSLSTSWKQILAKRSALPSASSCQAYQQNLRKSIIAAASLVAQSSKKEHTLRAKLLAEFIGTYMIVQLGCGVVCTAIYMSPGAEMMWLPAIWGLVVAFAVYAVRDISGAHFNPAVTATLAINKDFPPKLIIPYVLAQTLGAFVAGAANYIIFNKAIVAYELAKKIVRGSAASTASFHGAFGLVVNSQVLSPLGGFFAEAWMTGILVFGIFALTDSNNSVPNSAAPALIGGLVTILISIFAPLTGCGMNPARDLGPRFVTMMTGWGSAATSCWWAYSLGPIVGAVLGGALYNFMLSGANAANPTSA